jgi:hypothetical protein
MEGRDTNMNKIHCCQDASRPSLGNIRGRRDKPNKASDFRTSSNVVAKFGKRCRNQSNIWYCNSQKKRHNKQQKR